MYHYKPADVACEYCINSRRRRCRESGCPWLAERIEAGVVSYASAVRGLFGGVENEAQSVVTFLPQPLKGFCGFDLQNARASRPSAWNLSALRRGFPSQGRRAVLNRCS